MINQRLFTRIIIALLIVVSLSALTIYSLPIIVQSKILAIIEQETNRKASLNKIRVSFLPLTIQLQQFAIPETDGKPFASFDSLYISINALQSLKQSMLVFDKVALVKPIIHLIKQKNGSFNFDSLVKKKDDNQQENAIFPVSITKLSLSEGNLIWEDSFIKESVQPINLTVDNLSTAPNEKCQTTLQLSLASGGQLNWQSETSINPLHSTGHIQLNNIKLPRLLAVVSPEMKTTNFNGDTLFDSNYTVSYADNLLSFATNKTHIELHNFQYTEKDLVVKAVNVSHEADIKITDTKDGWLFATDKSKFNLHNFDFSELNANKTTLKIPTLSHETDFKIRYAPKPNDWQFTVNKSTLTVNDGQFSIEGQAKLAIKAANLIHGVDKYTANFSNRRWQISANKTKIDVSDVQIDHLSTLFKIPLLSVETAINLPITDKGVQVNLKQGKLNSQHIQLFEKTQDKPLFEIPTLALNGVDFNLDKQEFTIDSLTADGADFRSWLNPKGLFNYQTLFPNNQIEEKLAIVEAKSAPWAINIKQIALTNFAATFEDRTLKKPVMVILKPVDFNLTGYSNKVGVKLPFQLNAGINKTGSIQLNGDSTLEPFSARLAISAKAIELEPFQSYLEKIAHLDIIDGRFATTGKLAIAIPNNKPLDLTLTSDVSITDLITRDQQRHKDFITWQSLVLKALAVDLQKDSYTADTLVIHKPYAKVTIKKDKTINFSDIFISDSQPTTPKTSSKAVTKQQQAYFKLNKVQVINGSSDFADKSLILPFAAQINGLDGGASDISSDKKSTIKVSLTGNAYDLAPVDIAGQVSPYLGNYDLNLNFKGMPMPLMSSYMVEFAGYKVEKGKMSLGLKYKVLNDELTASNNILIDQFELGEKVENPRAVSLPLELAIALLKDYDGRIKIDVPLTGSLNDPQFSIGAIVSDALVNALSKVISSPFRALASLADSDEEFSSIHFSAGNAVLNKTQYEKLTALATVLKQRPVLMLDIKGIAFQQQDWPAMRETALYDLLKKARADEINKHTEKKILPEYVTLSDADYKRLLAELFIEKFPTLAKKSLFGQPELINTKSGDFYEVAKQQLSASLQGEKSRLKKLAGQRAQAIASYLVNQSSVPNAQVFILDTMVDTEKNSDIASVLSLKEHQ
ncbi:hypothetical protein BCS42_07870 [Crenothrix sp. D3]|nr:hypothetical protein BCS42_07870 [Crenothrix sp. D3]